MFLSYAVLQTILYCLRFSLLHVFGRWNRFEVFVWVFVKFDLSVQKRYYLEELIGIYLFGNLNIFDKDLLKAFAFQHNFLSDLFVW